MLTEDLPHFCAVADEANLRTQRLNFREDNSYNVRPVKFAEAMGTGTPSPLEDPLEQRPDGSYNFHLSGNSDQ